MPRVVYLTPSSSVESEKSCASSPLITKASSSLSTFPLIGSSSSSSSSSSMSISDDEEEEDDSSCTLSVPIQQTTLSSTLLYSSRIAKERDKNNNNNTLSCQFSSSVRQCCCPDATTTYVSSVTRTTPISKTEQCCIHHHYCYGKEKRYSHKRKKSHHHLSCSSSSSSSNSFKSRCIRGGCIGGLCTSVICLVMLYVLFFIQSSSTSSSSYQKFCQQPLLFSSSSSSTFAGSSATNRFSNTFHCLWNGPITNLGEIIVQYFIPKQCRISYYEYDDNDPSTSKRRKRRRSSSSSPSDMMLLHCHDHYPVLCWFLYPLCPNVMDSTTCWHSRRQRRTNYYDDVHRIHNNNNNNNHTTYYYSLFNRIFHFLNPCPSYYYDSADMNSLYHVNRTVTSRIRGSMLSSRMAGQKQLQKQERSRRRLSSRNNFLWPYFWSSSESKNNNNAANNETFATDYHQRGVIARRDKSTSSSSSFSSSLLDPLVTTTESTTESISNINAGPSKLVIAGQMIVEESECNIAQLDLETNDIDKDERIQLSLYNSYNGGEVYSLLANQSYIGPKKVVQNSVTTTLFPHGSNNGESNNNNKHVDKNNIDGSSAASSSSEQVGTLDGTTSTIDADDEMDNNDEEFGNSISPLPSPLSQYQTFLGRGRRQQGLLSYFRRERNNNNNNNNDDSTTTTSSQFESTTTRQNKENNNEEETITIIRSGLDADSNIVPSTMISDDEETLPVYRYGRELIVVGAFDTTYRNSQVTYCSVGRWDGKMLNKVGEGLCNSALSKGMKITSAAFAGPNDVYVAGSFHTQVWNGDQREFVKIFNIAHFNAINQVWLPLPVGQLTCSWCVVTVLALAWDNKRKQLHVAGKFNAIDNRNVPAGLALYDYDSGHLVAHPGGGLSLQNITEDGVGTALQMDQENGVLYVMGSYERLTTTQGYCKGLAALEVDTNRWTCLADLKHTVEPTGGGNMLLTPYGLMVAGKVQGDQTTWPNPDKPYTIALLTINKLERYGNITGHEFEWSWLPGFDGHDDPIHCLSNGYGDHEGTVFIGGDNFVAKWRYKEMKVPSSEIIYDDDDESDLTTGATTNGKGGGNNHNNNVTVDGSNNNNSTTINKDTGSTDSFGGSSGQFSSRLSSSGGGSSGGSVLSNVIGKKKMVMQKVPVTETLSSSVRGSVMAISQLVPEDDSIKNAQQQILIPHDSSTDDGGLGGGGGSTDTAAPFPVSNTAIGYYILAYSLALGTVLGMLLAILCNKNLDFVSRLFVKRSDLQVRGISLDTLTYSAVENSTVAEACQRALRARFVDNPHLLTIINPAEIVVHGIIGEGTFGRVWSASWRSADVAVKEFVFAQAAVAGRSSQQQNIIDDIIGEASMMAMLRHPNVLQMFGCCLTSQAIWIVSELCSLGSLRQLLDDPDRITPNGLKLSLALQIAEGMTYLHTQNPPIIHRDLKSHNIFVHETFTHQTIKNKQKGGSSSKKKKLSSQSSSKYGSGKKQRKSLSNKWNSADANDEHDQDDATATTTNNSTGGVSQLLSSKKRRRRGSSKNNGSTSNTTGNTQSMIIAKIGDWGTARAEKAGSRTMTHGVGTACWLAPEVIKFSRCSQLSDVFSFGIILWELATREEVYQGLETMQIIAQVANENLRPPVPPNCIWKELMVQCWHEDPSQRPNFETIVRELNVLLSRDRLSSLSSSESMSGEPSTMSTTTTTTTTNYQNSSSSNNNGVLVVTNRGVDGGGG